MPDNAGGGDGVDQLETFPLGLRGAGAAEDHDGAVVENAVFELLPPLCSGLAGTVLLVDQTWHATFWAAAPLFMLMSVTVVMTRHSFPSWAKTLVVEQVLVTHHCHVKVDLVVVLVDWATISWAQCSDCCSIRVCDGRLQTCVG
jgi:hypothetical protein